MILQQWVDPQTAGGSTKSGDQMLNPLFAGTLHADAVSL